MTTKTISLKDFPNGLTDELKKKFTAFNDLFHFYEYLNEEANIKEDFDYYNALFEQYKSSDYNRFYEFLEDHVNCVIDLKNEN